MIRQSYNFNVSFNITNESYSKLSPATVDYIRRVIKQGIQDALESCPVCEEKIIGRVNVDPIS